MKGILNEHGRLPRMNGFMPRYTIIKPPPLEHWSQWCRDAPEDELISLSFVAIDCLRADGPDRRWVPYIGVAGEAMRNRGLMP